MTAPSTQTVHATPEELAEYAHTIDNARINRAISKANLAWAIPIGDDQNVPYTELAAAMHALQLRDTDHDLTTNAVQTAVNREQARDLSTRATTAEITAAACTLNLAVLAAGGTAGGALNPLLSRGGTSTL